jgi:hypothetical protein
MDIDKYAVAAMQALMLQGQAPGAALAQNAWAAAQAMQANEPVNPNVAAYIGQDIFWYITTFAALGVAGSATASAIANIQIDAQSDFFWQKGMFFANVGGVSTTEATQWVPNIQVLLIGATQNQLSVVPVPISAMFGSAKLPFILTAARRFPANSNIQIQVTNLDPGNVFAMSLVFFGLKKYWANPTSNS